MLVPYENRQVLLRFTKERMDVFSFKFGNSEECDLSLQIGPWLFDGHLIVLKKWTEQVELERDLLSSVPVWVRLRLYI